MHEDRDVDRKNRKKYEHASARIQPFSNKPKNTEAKRISEARASLKSKGRMLPGAERCPSEPD